MAATSSVQDIKVELEQMLEMPKSDKGPPIADLGQNYIDDFAEIASLMTDKSKCAAHLASLNAQLVSRAEQANMRKQRTILRGYKNKLKKETFTYNTVDGRTVSGEFRTHGNILKTFLDEWENINGFNSGNKEGGLPGAPPLLTGWVQPPDFRKYLLKHAYHWTDIGVAEKHGEFTHRLHWYIICEENHANPSWLHYTPIELFKKCGDDETVRAGTGNTIWDRLFDCGTEIKSGPTAGHEVAFRRAEVLHEFLRLPATRKRKDLWAVAQIVNSRAGRVALINTLKQAGGAKRLDLDMDKRQSDLEDELLRVGDITSKIVWQKLQEGDTATADEFLRI